MEEIKKRIYDFIQQGKPGKLDRSMIQKALDFSSTKDFIALDNALNDLENEGLLYRGKKNTYFTAEQKGFVMGEVHLNRKGNGYVDLPDGSSILVYQDQLKGAFDRDLVLVKILKKARLQFGENLDEGMVVKVLEHKKTTLIGTFTKTRFGLRFLPDDEKLRSRDCIFLGDNDFHPSEGLKVKAKVECYQPLRVSLVEELGNVSDPGVDILAVLLDHDIEMEFPLEVKEQLKSIPDEVSEEEMVGRKNLCEEISITIDGNDSKDFDDAVSIKIVPEGYELKVHIADVTHYVTEDSPLDMEAYTRGTSTYVTDRVVPMLPHQLSNGICSLNPNVVRLTNTCEMIVGKDGRILSYELYPSVIKSWERMTYEDVNKIYAGDEELTAKYEYLKEFLFAFKDCTRAIRSQRHEKGAIDFDTVEAKIRCDESGKPVEIVARDRGIAEECIEDAMIAANVCVAHFMKKHEFPCVYRIHEEPSMKKMTEYSRMSKFLGHPFLFKGSVTPKEIQEYLESCEGSDDFEIISMAVLRCMQKAVYDPECVGHFGLAEKEYLHFTSPIRRYPDLIVHRMLRKYFYENNLEDITIDRAKMADFAEQSSVRERASQDAEYEVEDMKKAEYMEQFLGEVFEGMITSVTNFGFYVRLDNTVEGLVHVENLSDYFIYDENTLSLRGERSGEVYRAGMKVLVRLVGANKENRTIDFMLIQPFDVKAKRSEGYVSEDKKQRNRYKNERVDHRKMKAHGKDSSYGSKPKRFDRTSKNDRFSKDDKRDGFKKDYRDRKSSDGFKKDYKDRKPSDGFKGKKFDGKKGDRNDRPKRFDSHRENTDGVRSDKPKSYGNRGKRKGISASFNRDHKDRFGGGNSRHFEEKGNRHGRKK